MTPESTPSRPAAPREAWAQLVARKLESLRYGTIQLTVHDGRIVQIDCTERTRLPSCRSAHDPT